MRYYFQLQWSISQRKLNELGIHPYVALVLSLVVFCGITELLYLKTSWASWLLIAMYASLALPLNESKRVEFIYLCFGKRISNKIRQLENAFVALPFATILLIKCSYWAASVLVLLVCMFPLFKLSKRFHFIIPTPFTKRPFEFIIGLRRTIVWYILLLMLLIIAISVNNYNLGLVSMMAVFVMAMSFYTPPESSYFVWIFRSNAPSFLNKKAVDALWNSILLTAVFLVLLLIFFSEKYGISLLCWALGLFAIQVILMAKYATYPYPINLFQTVLLALCLYFPPLLLFIIPFFIKKSIRQLNLYLDD